jgi:preprotein translocase subunit YajC
MFASWFTLLADAEKAAGSAPAGPAAPGGSLFDNPMQLILLFVAPLLLLWLFVMRPQQKQAKEQREQLNKLKKNDEVITAGGIIGTVVNVKEKAGGIAGDEDVITIRLDGNTRMQVIRSSIAKVAKADEGKKDADTNPPKT